MCGCLEGVAVSVAALKAAVAGDPQTLPQSPVNLNGKLCYHAIARQILVAEASSNCEKE